MDENQEGVKAQAPTPGVAAGSDGGVWWVLGIAAIALICAGMSAAAYLVGDALLRRSATAQQPGASTARVASTGLPPDVAVHIADDYPDFDVVRVWEGSRGGPKVGALLRSKTEATFERVAMYVVANGTGDTSIGQLIAQDEFFRAGGRFYDIERVSSFVRRWITDHPGVLCAEVVQMDSPDHPEGGWVVSALSTKDVTAEPEETFDYTYDAAAGGWAPWPPPMTDADVRRIAGELFPMYQMDAIVRRTTPGSPDSSVYMVLQHRTVKGFRCALDAVELRDYGATGWYGGGEEVYISDSPRTKAFMKSWVAARPGTVIVAIDSGTGDQPGEIFSIDYAESVSAFATAQIGMSKAAWEWDAASSRWRPIY